MRPDTFLKLLGLAGASVFTAALGATAASAAPALDLSAYAGKVVYLDFWASWCQPCHESFPYMEQLKARYGKDGLVIIAVNLDHAKSRADAFLRQAGSDLDIVYDPDGKIAAQYQVRDMPTSVLIGRDGKVRYVYKGFHAEETRIYSAQVGELVHDN